MTDHLPVWHSDKILLVQASVTQEKKGLNPKKTREYMTLGSKSDTNIIKINPWIAVLKPQKTTAISPHVPHVPALGRKSLAFKRCAWWPKPMSLTWPELDPGLLRTPSNVDDITAVGECPYMSMFLIIRSSKVKSPSISTCLIRLGEMSTPMASRPNLGEVTRQTITTLMFQESSPNMMKQTYLIIYVTLYIS